jgi:His-Xaa-Ser system protein HxsD
MGTEEGTETNGSLEAIPRTDGELRFLVDEQVYSREAVLRACYWFTDRCYLFVSRPTPGHLLVAIRAKAGGPPLDAVAGDFGNALLDQQVRQDIQRETARLRELIVAKAFAEGNLLDDAPVGDDRDPVELVRSNRPGSIAPSSDESE